MNRGGQVLAPAPDRGIQPIDVRDLADFLLDQIEGDGTGVYNVAPEPGQATYGSMLQLCADIAAVPQRPVSFVWADEDWLVHQGVNQWTELPLWRNAAAPWGMKTARAQAAGLHCRPLVQTVEDTWDWLKRGGRPVDHERFGEHGIDQAREESVIKQWLAERRRA